MLILHESSASSWALSADSRRIWLYIKVRIISNLLSKQVVDSIFFVSVLFIKVSLCKRNNNSHRASHFRFSFPQILSFLNILPRLLNDLLQQTNWCPKLKHLFYLLHLRYFPHLYLFLLLEKVPLCQVNLMVYSFSSLYFLLQYLCLRPIPLLLQLKELLPILVMFFVILCNICIARNKVIVSA